MALRQQAQQESEATSAAKRHRAEETARSIALQEWSRNNITELALPVTHPELGAHRCPTGDGDGNELPFGHVQFVPPALDMAARILSDRRSNPAAHRKILRELWDGRHRGVRHEDITPLPGTAMDHRVSDCLLAGFCICRVFKLREFTRALQRVLRKEFSGEDNKHRLPRKNLGKGIAVLRVHAPGKPFGESPEADFWWHIGYSNLRDYLFSFLPLEWDAGGQGAADRIGVAGLVALLHRAAFSDGTVVPKNMWEAGRDVNRRQDWDYEFVQLYADPDESRDVFHVGAVAVQACQPSFGGPLWRVEQEERRRERYLPLPPRPPSSSNDVGPRPARPLPLTDLYEPWVDPGVQSHHLLQAGADLEAAADWDMSDDENTAQVQGQQQPQQRRPRPRAAASARSSADGGGAGAGHVAAGAGSSADGAGGGARSSSGSGGQPGPPADGGGGSPAGDIPDIASGGAPPPPAAPAEPRPARRGGPRGASWPNRPVEGTGGGRIVHNVEAASSAAHCDVHGSLCRINRVIAKRPMGYLLAWLAATDKFTSRQAHMAARLDRLRVDDTCSLPNRARSRTLGEAMPALAPAFALEPSAPDGQPDEPVNL